MEQGKKIFVSYKYGDKSVQHLFRNKDWEETKVRDYVDEFQEKLANTNHINKGELDGEDLSQFKNSTIESKLRDKIYDSSVTVVFISPNMKDYGLPESEQWIPWEIAYSLRETTRNDRTSHRNAVLAVVLPDRYGSYSYMLEPKTCCDTPCTTWHTDKLFRILSSNMFNKKNPSMRDCPSWKVVYNGYFSYIHMVRWCDFIESIDFYIKVAESICDKSDEYDIHVNV